MTTVCLRSLPTKAWQAAQTEQFMLFQIRHRGLSAPKCFLLSFRACSGISGSASVRLQCSTLECACSVCTGYVFFGHTPCAHCVCVCVCVCVHTHAHARFVCACTHSFEFNCINVSTWRLQARRKQPKIDRVLINIHCYIMITSLIIESSLVKPREAVFGIIYK